MLKNCFRRRNALKKCFSRRIMQVFFVFLVLGSNFRGQKILFSLHILTLWTETYPKIKAHPYTSSWEGTPPSPPPLRIMDFLFTWPFTNLGTIRKICSMEHDCSRFHAFFTIKFWFCYITFLLKNFACLALKWFLHNWKFLYNIIT